MAVLGTQTQEHPRGCDVERALSTELSKPFRGAGQPVLGLNTKLIGKPLPLHYSPNSAQPKCVI